jgi:hypothetical protein
LRDCTIQIARGILAKIVLCKNSRNVFSHKNKHEQTEQQNFSNNNMIAHQNSGNSMSSLDLDSIFPLDHSPKSSPKKGSTSPVPLHGGHRRHLSPCWGDISYPCDLTHESFRTGEFHFSLPSLPSLKENAQKWEDIPYPSDLAHDSLRTGVFHLSLPSLSEDAQK